ncbi:MAG: DNA-binding NarL/FixJ family response regulator [Dokdonia sp.]|jgi:DNA-binding NarL/FixJ family response regulator
MTTCNVVLVDDHTLFAKALKTLISSFEDAYVTFAANNVQEFVAYIEDQKAVPDVVLLDVRMPKMDGIAAMRWIQEHHPEINVIAITMEDDEEAISQMIQYGCKGYLLKDVEPSKLKASIQKAVKGNYVYSEEAGKAVPLVFEKAEQKFVHYICGTDLNYREIAKRMSLSPSTIDNLRTELYRKLGVNSRISAVLFAMEHRLLKSVTLV